MIRDTSAQDAVLTAAPIWRSKKIYVWSGIAIAIVVGLVVVLSAWAGSTKSVNVSRLKVAQVSRGLLVRDVAVNGRMVAAISPTLYSTAASTVTLKVKAGDTVKKGDIVAELESPDFSLICIAPSQQFLFACEDTLARHFRL